MIATLVILEFLVSERKITCALVDTIRWARCIILGLPRLPPIPRQFHARNIMAPVAP